jgi:hypothetical protein
MADQKLKVDIIGDASKLNKALNTASGKLQSFGSKVSGVGKRLSIGLSLPLGIAGGAAIKMASDFEESMNKVDVAFGKSSGEVKKFAKTTLSQFGIAQGTALDMAALFGDMSTSMGLTTGEAANMSTSLVGLAGDLASFKNMNIQEVTTALNGVFTGETESLKRLGIVMTQVNLQQFAQEKGIKKTIKAMTQAEKVNLRYQFVMSKTTNAQGDFARTSDGAANQMRIFQESMKELGANIGAIILPAFIKVVKFGNNLVNFFKNLDGDTKTLVVTIASLAAVLPLVVTAVGFLSTALGVILGPVGLTVIALTGLLFYFNEIRNVVNDFVIDLKTGFLNTLVKVQDGFQKFMIRIETAVSLMSAFLKDGFDADFDSIFESQADQIDEISKNTGKEIEKNLDASKILKQYNDLPPTLNVIKDLISDIGKGAGFGVTTTVSQTAVADFSGFGIKNGVFNDPLKPLATSASWATISQNVKDMDQNFQNLEENRFQSLKEKANQVGEAVAGAFSSLANNVIGSLGLADDGFQGFIKGLLGTIAQLIAMMLSAAVSQAIMGATASGAATGPAAVITTPAFIATAVGGVLSAFAAIPKFANGGIVSGPTLGLMGEYSGAKSNPEVIAPLDKLKGMMGGTGSQNINVGGEFRIQGQDLVVALQRAEKNRSRLL